MHHQAPALKVNFVRLQTLGSGIRLLRVLGWFLFLLVCAPVEIPVFWDCSSSLVKWGDNNSCLSRLFGGSNVSRQLKHYVPVTLNRLAFVIAIMITTASLRH
jgi:hypothetical protein